MIDRVNAVIVSVALDFSAHARDGFKSLRKQEGQAFVEYALVLTLVAVAVALLAQWGLFTDALRGALNRVENVIQGAGQAP